MKEREQLTDEEKRLRRRVFRTNVVYGLVFLSFTSLILRASYIQIAKGKTLRQTELTTQFTKIPVLPQRGWIYDANGQVLAWDKPTMNIVMNRYTTLSKSQYQQIAQTLAPVLKTTASKLYTAMQENTGAIQVVLAMGATDKQVAFVVEHQSQLPSVQVVQDYNRQYPNGDLAGQVLGYVGALTASDAKLPQYKNYLYTQKVGETGIEREYEPQLQGKPGYNLVTIDSSGNAVGSVGSVPPIDGDNIQLTLDGHEQAEAQMIMQKQIQSLKNASVDNASAVMLNVKNGGVIAMVSYPYLDPNWYTNGSYVHHVHYLENSGAQLNNVIGTFNYPGSTVKPANMLTALKAGVVTPNTVVEDDGYIYIGTQRKNEDEGLEFGAVHPIQAITISSDVFFYQVGLWLGKWFNSSTSSPGGYPSADGSYQGYLNTDFAKGINQLFQGEEDFGLGMSTGIDLPYENTGSFYIEDSRKGNAQVKYDLKASEKSIQKTGKYVNYGSPASLADAAIGQSQMFTPMELGQYVMTLADGGKKLQPHLLKGIYDANSTPDSGAKPIRTAKTVVQNVVHATPGQWTIIKQGMSGVANTPNGTAYSAFAGAVNPAHYEAAGKTGTAQIYIQGHPTDNSVFICYAPLNNPIVAVAVMAPGGGYGAQFSAIIARQMIDAYFNEHHEPFMPKSGWTSTAIPANWTSSPAYQVPEQSS